jgi:ABC-type multidrug transport system ATPase subunit
VPIPNGRRARIDLAPSWHADRRSGDRVGGERRRREAERPFPGGHVPDLAGGTEGGIVNTTPNAVRSDQPDRFAGARGGSATDRELVIETRALTKRYGEAIVAVDALDLRVRCGEVYGFLGPNGAGKTTTLRMLLGLVRPTSGQAAVLGAPPGSREGLARIGAMVEAPAFYPYLSGRDNLRVLARYAGVAEDRVEAVLHEVRLIDRAADRSRTYSLGMKQRLGVAAALLKDPELLILDEPTNGLDPAGMAEMRDFLRSLGKGGRTVLLSSHLMGEVEQVTDRVGVIRDGALLVRHGKGGLRREVGMDEWGWEQLRLWLAARVELPVGPLFCIIDGPTRGRPWSGAAVGSEFRRIAARAGVRRRFAPHGLRHAHALERAREGVPLNIHPAPARPRRPRHHQHLSAGDRSGGDHHRGAHAPRADDVRQRRTAALINSDGRAERERHGAPAPPWAKRAPWRDSPRRSRLVQGGGVGVDRGAPARV